MGRGTIRECIRRAQAAEVAGRLDEAVRELEEAARLHILRNEEGRAAVLVRHGLRLRPDHQALLELLERVGSAEEPPLPDEPVSVVDASPELPSSGRSGHVPEEPLRIVEVEGGEQAPLPLPGARERVVPQRGPTLADPSADHWCSFCCQPKAEAGPMVAGPAGAYICAKCLEVAATLLGDAGLPAKAGLARAGAGAGSAVDVRPTAAASPPEPQRDLDFIEAAVVLSKKLGWGLSEVRSLTPEELRRALKKLEELGDGR